MRELFSTLFYNILIKLNWLQRRRYTAGIWHVLFAFGNKRFTNIVSTTIHGRKVRVNFGYPYPFIARTIKTFNNPLIELLYRTYEIKEAPVNAVDVGASVGDTILSLVTNCPGMVGTVYCVEGESGFYELLTHNMRNFGNMKLFRVMLSSENGVGKKLVRIHAGTASSIGEESVPTMSLDTLSQREHIGEVDIVKIDVDGYDGRVLQGARKFLRENSPDVIFEWHPTLCKKAGNAPQTHFKILAEGGYATFIFFNKFGEFSHFMTGVDRQAIDALAHYCMEAGSPEDWHYDVIALHRKSGLNPLSLAALSYARNKPSPF